VLHRRRAPRAHTLKDVCAQPVAPIPEVSFKRTPVASEGVGTHLT
jgi:hypothetical protein